MICGRHDYDPILGLYIFRCLEQSAERQHKLLKVIYGALRQAWEGAKFRMKVKKIIVSTSMTLWRSARMLDSITLRPFLKMRMLKRD
jgi:hypothetical protein